MADKAKPEEKPTGLALLRAPFPANCISKLPKESRAQIDERKADRNKVVWNCEVCGGTHHKNAVHLDYVGHAALTDRLLDCDPAWAWEPFAVSADGLPLMDRNGGLWIRLTVCGVTRNGYGDADGKTGGNAIKEAIGDALRNAAMRFGAALDLWHKGDLHAEPEAEAAEEPTQETPASKPGTKANSRELFSTLQKGLRNCKSARELRQWGIAFADSIKQLPKDWGDEIRAEYKAEMNAFMDLEIAEEQANG